MGKCAVKRGIVALRDCGNEASDACATCARAICREHTKIRGAELLCVECFARGERENEQRPGTSAAAKPATAKNAPAAAEESWEDASWPYYYRHGYYTTSYYHPFYTGIYNDNYYSDYDVRSFSEPAAGDLNEDDSTAGGFYDS